MARAQTTDPPGYAWTHVDEGTATEAIALVVAEAEGTSPMDLDPPLDDVVDTDLLDRLFTGRHDGTREAAGRVIFPYRGHEVTVTADGYVTIGTEGERDLA